jgi:GNAT superfamily N-acetyltransferase
MATLIYHLEMVDRDAFRPKVGPAGFQVDEVSPADPELNRRFYRDVGGPWKWTDRLVWSDSDWRCYVSRDSLRTWIGRFLCQEVGYFELEAQDNGNVEIAYFGLLPQSIGQGLGGPFLSAAVYNAWAMPGTRRVCVHTCTWDHAHALSNYVSRGFQIFKTVRK